MDGMMDGMRKMVHFWYTCYVKLENNNKHKINNLTKARTMLI